MAAGVNVPVLLLLVLSLVTEICVSKVLTPPTFNLAKGKKITATSTCGLGIATPDLFCRLTGATGEKRQSSIEIIQGQHCDYCDPSIPALNHSVENAIDGTERWWQSPPLSRGNEYNQVNVTIDLNQEFHIYYIIIKMANSPRPGVWALEKSEDYGKTWKPWQYFADSPTDCMEFFNVEVGKVFKTDDQVICTTKFSRIVPLENGEIVVSLVNNRPSASNFSYADTIMDFTRATTVRLRLLRTKTLLGHLMAVARQDSTVTRRYYYSIKDISLGGHCACHGHAENCNYADPSRPDRLVCDCQHNTMGDQCERCDAERGFVQKKWQPARSGGNFVCEPCQCFGRATGCVYDPVVDEERRSIDIHGFYYGGGVCQNCLYNSTGINCEQCLPGYFRPVGVPLTMLDMCKPCECDPQFHTGNCIAETGQCECREEYTGDNCETCSPGYYGYPNCIPCECAIIGTEGKVCYVEEGQCPCKENYVGKKCDMCLSGYYDYPECRPCHCDGVGAVDQFCDLDIGQCTCQMNYAARNCSECSHGYYNYPDCTLCNCDPQGTEEQVCDVYTGECVCKSNFNTVNCGECARGYYQFPNCYACECKEPGSLTSSCNEKGQCSCKPNFAGMNCERCAAGFYRYPDCVPCDCDMYGSFGRTCDQETGQCDCHYNFQSLMCSKCKENLYNYPNCEECNCNPAGAREVPGYPLGGCGEVIAGRLCECKERVIGRICDTCKPGYWNLNRNNILGCEGCTCSDAGSIAGMNICNMITGQCMCKVDVTGRNCDRCKDGFYGLHKTNLFGCVECDCDVGGSMSTVCDKETGQCPCKGRVEGRRCDEPIQRSFIPSLDHLKFEIEDGLTPEGTPIRYGYDERLFPDYSWKGYAILIKVQPEVLVDIEIAKPSLYRLVYRFVNFNERSIRGDITFKPESEFEIAQESSIMFIPTDTPSMASAGNFGGLSTFVLNPGRWTVGIKVEDSVFLDYMVLIPQSYYEATNLQSIVQRPCLVPDDNGPCIHYSYPDVTEYPRVLGEDGYIIDGDQRISVTLFDNPAVLEELGVNSMAILNGDQNTFELDLGIPETDRYVLLVNYHTSGNNTQNILLNVNGTQATAILYSCSYSMVCRQVLTDLDEMEAIFNFENGTVNIEVIGDDTVDANIESIVAVPYNDWTIGYIRPNIVCIRVNGVCVGSRYATPVGSVRIEFEDLPNEHLISAEMPPGLVDSNVVLVQLNETLNLIVLLGTAKATGLHKFLVHYYLPGDPGKDLDVEVHANGQIYPGVFRPRYCPGIHGCRGLIYFDGGSKDSVDLQEMDVKIVFNNTNNIQIWLDYLLVMQAGQFSSQDVTLLPVDNSNNFINTCIDDIFKIKDTAPDFCSTYTFTLTTEFNNGAMECDCDIDGSLSFICDPNGGQCRCRPHVIGRVCSACREGFYDFPRCKPCNCPFGLCHRLTGDCICPPRVTGERCDQCMNGTYGYDPLIGCEECLCNQQGVVAGVMNCEENSGQCSCLPGIGGRKCDYCLAGFHSFPRCMECDCSHDGTIEDICDSDTAYCMCKVNVMGARCDECNSFTYNLDPENPEGCTNCFCFGNTASCRESSLYWSQMMEMEGWGVTNTVDGEVREAGTTIAVLDTLDKIVDTSTSIYWTAPAGLLGNKVTSYGGSLMYEVLYVLPRNDSIIPESIIEPDVILQGNNITVVHRAATQVQSGVVTSMSVKLFERHFQHAESGAPVERDQFMMALVNLQSLQIRASYYSLVHEIRLMNVALEYASEAGTGEQSMSLEMCQCPTGYTGTSCETCAAGFYRLTSYPFLGACVPCECYGHADTCDSQTGMCMDCHDNTMGEHCELCRPGYYGDPQYEVCSICGCPMTVESNNFAESCTVIEGNQVISCDCDEGYAGDKCERCAPGYFGNPNEIGGNCERCSCSENINMYNPDSCDYQTGACLVCINNATGPNCEQCVDWWYGDAVEAKNCYPCSCDQCGSLICDSNSGGCTCKPNVIGLDCDRCAPDHWGFEGCDGCESCGCGIASLDTQCDAYTGNCSCQPGVKGQHCEDCVSGYWNYRETGCEACQCEFDGATTCNPEDGSCLCLPGVTGDKCDTCLDRWVLIPGEGCRECDVCMHHLMDDVETMDYNITAIELDLKTVSIGVTAMRRLDAVNQTNEDYKPLVEAVLNRSDNITLDPVEKDLQKLDMVCGNIQTRTVAAIADADNLNVDIAGLLNNSDHALILSNMSDAEADNAVKYGQEVLNNILQGIQVTNIETYIALTEAAIDDIRGLNFSDSSSSVNMELEAAEELLEQVKQSQMRPMNLQKSTSDVFVSMNDMGMRLLDLQNSSMDSEATSTTVLAMTAKLRKDDLSSIEIYIKDLNELEDMSIDRLESSQDLLEMANQDIHNGTESFRQLEASSSSLHQAKAAIGAFSKMYDEALNQTIPKVEDAIAHADMLLQQANELEKMYTDTRDMSANAVGAGTAYDNIVEAIEAAQNASELAMVAADSALIKTDGVGESSQVLISSSEELLSDANIRFNTTQTDLYGRLTEAVKGTDNVQELNRNVQAENRDLNGSMNNVMIDVVGQKAAVVQSDIDVAVVKVETTKNRINYILEELPEQFEKTTPLANSMISTNREITLVKTQVGAVKKFIPDITNLLLNLNEQSENVKTLGARVTTDINALREKIAIARNQANLIRVGLKFVGNTTVTLRNPRNIAQAGSYSQVSMFIRTQATDALLLYAGTDSYSGRTNQDFMSLELKNGQVVFKFDLGSGLAEITHSQYVSDNVWYKITAKRIGKAGTLTLARDPLIQPELGSVTGESPGTNTVLELNRLTTKFFVGGIPSSASVSGQVRNVYYVGMMEEVEFDERPMGMWNFISGENNFLGAKERNVMTSVISNGFRFDGNGYVILSTAKTGWKPSVALQVSFKFKTYAENGLIFFAGKAVDFVSIEIRDGKVLFQYDLGKGRAILETSEIYNDGEWHDIQVSRRLRQGVLFVDQVKVSEAESPEGLDQLSIGNVISVGGYQEIIIPVRDVTKQGFEGCIQDLALQVQMWDLNDNVKAKGISPGCPEQVARVATFSSDKLSYVAKPSESIGENFDMTFKVKTKQTEALLFYATRDNGTEGFSVSMVDGKIVVINDPGDGLESRIELTSRVNTYNDGRWHYISIMKMGNKLMLNIDDYEMVQMNSQGPSSLDTNQPMYFGNADINIPSSLVGSKEALSGCIGDVTVNGVFLNFANLQKSRRPGISLSGCPIPDPEGPYDRIELPTLPPGLQTTQPTTDAVTLPAGQCALPVSPPFELASADTIRGTVFGTYPNSHVEYDTLPGNVRIKSVISLEFKTVMGDGILLYMTDTRHTDFISLVIINGQIRYSFDCGTGPGIILSEKTYTDDRWHTIQLGRNQKEGTMAIDGEEAGLTTSQNRARSINIKRPYYVGGYIDPVPKEALSDLGGVTSSFQGCISNLQLNSAPFSPPARENGTRPCTDTQELGAYFHGSGGYIQLMDKFNVGLEMSVSLQIRPRSRNGVIFSVHSSREDFVVLQMVDGVLSFTADNGAGSIMAKFTPPMDNTLCDGSWHTVVVEKTKNVVSLTVDNYDTILDKSRASATSADTDKPFYIGGKPDSVKKGIITDGNYLGCVRSLVVNGETQYLATGIAFADVDMKACPTE